MTYLELLDLPYTDSDDADLTLDAYLVDRANAPLLMHVHGGGFFAGAKSGAHNGRDAFLREEWIFGRALAAGISVVSINYRRTESHPYPTAAEDLARAIQFSRHKAVDWGIDPGRLALCGLSAGGNMAVRVAFDSNRADPASVDPVARQSTIPNLVVVMHTPCDMGRFDPEWVAQHDAFNRKALECLGRCSIEDYNRTPESRRLVALASPIDLLHSGGPPLQLVYLDKNGCPTGSLPEYVNDPHSAWYGVQLAEALERAEADFRFTVLTEDEWWLEGNCVLEFLRERFLNVGAGA